jgi:TrmH family RNA methyltransferase
MSVTGPRAIASRDNPLPRLLKALAEDNTAWRKAGQVWLEGDHLCRAAQQRGWAARAAVYSSAAWSSGRWRGLAAGAGEAVVLDDRLFASISALPSPAGVGWLLDLPAAPVLDPGVATLVLDRVQDAGNVGSMLRSAAAFGVRQVVALKGSAALWSPKVLRAGMGAHFGLALFDAADASRLDELTIPMLAADAHAANSLHDTPLPRPAAWVLGHEGQGLAPEVAARCALKLRIPQPGGEESLNVAAAAAVCLYESSRRG